MSKLATLKRPIGTELEAFERYFKASMKSRVSLLDRITYYIVKRKGKQLRPMFVHYCASLCGEISERTHIAASMVELLHTATLVHDDVVDDAMQRRGFFSINALWKNKAAVLIGDYLLSKGLLIALEHKEHRLLDVMSKAVKDMSEGELLQMEKSRSLNIDEATYFDIIKMKTASLVAASCAAGAVSATDDEKEIQALEDFGLNIGMAFQLKDDLFDYETNNVGKPVGNDLKEKKLTLPIIYILDRMSKSERSKTLKEIRRHHDDRKRMKVIIKRVRESEGINYTREKMLEYKNVALEHLYPYRDRPHYEALTQLVDFVISRSK